MQARFTYTPEDYVEAQRAYQRHLASRGKRVFGAAIFIVGILFVVAGVYLVVSRGDMFPTIFCLVYGGFVVLYYGPLKAARFRRDFHKAKTLQGEKTAVVGGEGVYISGAFGESKLHWSAFARYSETPNLFVLFIPPRLFQMLPKRAFSNAGQDVMRQLLAQEVGTKKR